MKICGACCNELSRDAFSKKQWQQKQHQRRCKGCITENNPLQLERPSCWICLGEGPDEDGLPLRRECSCRGSSGYCHLKCVAKYAQGKSIDNWQRTEQWVLCPNCEQQYGDHFSLELANEFVSYIEKKFPPLRYQHDPRKLAVHVMAHQVKVMAIKYQKDVDELRKSANFILSTISRIKRVEPHPPEVLLDAGADAHFRLGALSEVGGTEEDYETAITHYQKARDLSKEVGDETNAAMYDKFATETKAKREGNHFDEEEAEALQTQLLLESLEQHDIEKVAELWEKSEHEHNSAVAKHRELYEESVASWGGGNPLSVDDGVKLVLSLKNAGHGIEAERLASDVFVISRRVLGSRHESTMIAQKALHYCKTRIVGYAEDRGLSTYLLLDYDAAEDKYVIKGPLEGTVPDIVLNGTENNQGEEIVVDASRVWPRPGTPVFGFGLEDELSHLNGKLADFRDINLIPFKMRVHFEEEDKEHLIDRENIRVAMNCMTEKE